MKAPVDAREASGWFSWLSIFTSAGTLVCCALPAALVGIGAGASLAALVGVFPQLVWLSEHKLALFVAAGIMLLVAGVFQVRARLAPCPADPALAAQCVRGRVISMRVYRVSIVIYAVGYYFAFIAPAFS